MGNPWLADVCDLDLSPLSYIAGTLIGNPFIQVWDGPKTSPRQIISCREAYAKHGLEPLVFSPKEHLGLLNGTAFSAAVASLALHDAVHLGLMTQVLTAMGTEAMLGVQGERTIVFRPDQYSQFDIVSLSRPFHPQSRPTTSWSGRSRRQYIPSVGRQQARCRWSP